MTLVVLSDLLQHRFRSGVPLGLVLNHRWIFWSRSVRSVSSYKCLHIVSVDVGVGTFLFVVILWFGISAPLSAIGSFFGAKHGVSAST